MSEPAAAGTAVLSMMPRSPANAIKAMMPRTPVNAIKAAARELADQYNGNNVQIEVHIDKLRASAKVNVRDLNVE